MASSATATADTSNHLDSLAEGATHDRKVIFHEVINGLVQDGFSGAPDDEKFFYDQRSQRPDEHRILIVAA
jgi:hypothetical protein